MQTDYRADLGELSEMSKENPSAAPQSREKLQRQYPGPMGIPSKSTVGEHDSIYVWDVLGALAMQKVRFLSPGRFFLGVIQMGMDATGQICFGYKVREFEDLPWTPKEGEIDLGIDDWWRKQQGYKPPFEMFDERGEWIGGRPFSDELRDEYYQAQNDFDASHPIPFELCDVCSHDYDQLVICVPSSKKFAEAGSPLLFEPADLCVSVEEEVALSEFVAQYNVPIEGKAGWYLSGYYG